MKAYSILLLYPDYTSDGVETYYDFVESYTPEGAVSEARKRCAATNNLELKDWENLAVLLVTEGHNHGV